MLPFETYLSLLQSYVQIAILNDPKAFERYALGERGLLEEWWLAFDANRQRIGLNRNSELKGLVMVLLRRFNVDIDLILGLFPLVDDQTIMQKLTSIRLGLYIRHDQALRLFGRNIFNKLF